VYLSFLLYIHGKVQGNDHEIRSLDPHSKFTLLRKPFKIKPLKYIFIISERLLDPDSGQMNFGRAEGKFSHNGMMNEIPQTGWIIVVVSF
jgi:hypothetical protein